MASDGSIYGTTEYGGSGYSDSGAVFRLAPNEGFTVLYSLGVDPAKGSQAFDGVSVCRDGSIAGTTRAGGAYDFGTVFKIAPGGALELLYSFGGVANDGLVPMAQVVETQDGSLYGTTSTGGAYGLGTVFRITPNGVVSTCHDFGGGFPDLTASCAGLVVGIDGNLYGACGGDGPLFRLTPSGVFTALASLPQGETYYVDGPLVQASDGAFFATASGDHGVSVFFRMTPTGGLTQAANDQGYSDGGLALGKDENLYGVSSYGGRHFYGSVFRATPFGKVSVIYSFPPDDYSPVGPLCLSIDGSFYGSTQEGGAGATIFRIAPVGGFKTIYQFYYSYIYPVSGFVAGADGTLYGAFQGPGGNSSVVNQFSPLYAFPYIAELTGPSPLTIPVLNNDRSSDTASIKIIAVSQPSFGEATISGGGKTVTYTPLRGRGSLLLSDSFTYTAEDSTGQTATAQVTIRGPRSEGGRH